ncbi:hypothetical protein [Arsukibacterium sp.]|uniref:hypothetical protein n=1 Tax=Arsukibacterium sp. TaxID=1977258 RepID=UPI002FDA7B64
MIRIATNEEALELYNQPEIVERVGVFAESFYYQPWVAMSGDAKMLFVFWVVDPGTVEVHIAQPRKYLKHSRELCFKIIHWLFQLGAKRIITDCPPGKIANLARKVGMTEYKSDPDTVYFEVKL